MRTVNWAYTCGFLSKQLENLLDVDKKLSTTSIKLHEALNEWLNFIDEDDFLCNMTEEEYCLWDNLTALIGDVAYHAKRAEKTQQETQPEFEQLNEVTI